MVQGRLRAPRVALLAEEVALTVDRASGMVARAVGTTGGAVNGKVRLEGLVVDPPVDRSHFAPPPAAAPRPGSEDLGFRRLPLGEVGAAAGYRPLVPSQLPAGFELREVAFAERAGSTGSDAHQNPPSRKVVSLAFHRGFERIVVTTRLRGAGAGATAWADPTGYSADEELGRPAPEKVTLDGGALAGAPAELATRIPELWGKSQLWALAEELVLTVWGDLGRDQLISLAESMEPHPGSSSPRLCQVVAAASAGMAVAVHVGRAGAGETSRCGRTSRSRSPRAVAAVLPFGGGPGRGRRPRHRRRAGGGGRR